MDCGQQDTREKAMLTGTGKDMLALLDEAKIERAKNAVDAVLLQRRGMAAMA
jgi:hypothetical protein